jgi:hypothetical protein
MGCTILLAKNLSGKVEVLSRYASHDHALSQYIRGKQAPEAITLSPCPPLLLRSISNSSFACIMDNNKPCYKINDALQELEMLAVNAKEAQQLILTKILERNQASEYLRKFMNGSTNISTFMRNVPVVTYDVVQPYIARISSGEDSSILCGERIVELLRRCASNSLALIVSICFCRYMLYIERNNIYFCWKFVPPYFYLALMEVSDVIMKLLGENKRYCNL